MTKRRYSFAASPAAGAAGFTVIELLVVISILAILVGLVISVGAHVRMKGLQDDTVNMLGIVQQAVDAYKDATGDYPEQDVDFGGPDYAGQAAANSQALLRDLRSVEASKDRLRNLPGGRIDIDNNTLIDAFGNSINYLRDGGAGGLPVIVSAGKDGVWNTSDDLRSDNR